MNNARTRTMPEHVLQDLGILSVIITCSSSIIFGLAVCLACATLKFLLCTNLCIIGDTTCRFDGGGTCITTEYIDQYHERQE